MTVKQAYFKLVYEERKCTREFCKMLVERSREVKEKLEILPFEEIP